MAHLKQISLCMYLSLWNDTTPHIHILQYRKIYWQLGISAYLTHISFSTSLCLSDEISKDDWRNSAGLIYIYMTIQRVLLTVRHFGQISFSTSFCVRNEPSKDDWRNSTALVNIYMTIKKVIHTDSWPLPQIWNTYHLVLPFLYYLRH